MLDVDSVSVGYRPDVVVVDAVTLSVEAGEALGVIGRNGAGKTCLAMGLMGLVPEARGRIRVGDREVGGTSARERVRAGLSLVPEGRHVFGQLTVHENLRVAAHAAGRRLQKADVEEVNSLFPVLSAKSSHRAASMSGGEQQMLAIARALVQHPACVVLDEPSLGLAPVAVQALAQSLRGIRDRGVALLLMEQNPHLLEELCSRVIMLDSGRVERELEPERLRDADVVAAYMGASLGG